MNLLSRLLHAVKMVRRNLRSYRLLSVTIILSFSLLLAYLGYVDSRSCNRYKEVFAQDRRLVFSLAETDPYTDRVLREKAAELGDTRSILIHGLDGFRLEIPNVALVTGEKPVDFGVPEILSLPGRVPAVYQTKTDSRYRVEQLPVTWLDGQEHPDVALAQEEIIVDEQLYRAVGQVCGGCLHLVLRSDFQPEDRLEGTFRIVGTVPGEGQMEIRTGEGEMKGKAVLKSGYTPRLIFSAAALDPSEHPGVLCTSVITFVSDQPELAAKLIESVHPNSVAIGAFRAQEEANAAMRAEKRTKALVCVAMLAILGINLFSCFENALSARRFEIGVKRAIGASAGSIVVQFLYEGICVMVLSLLASVALVTNGFLIYKLIYEHTPNAYGQYFQWIIYISPYSIGMFAACSIALTVVFSLIFAYRATQVRIAEQLKAE